MSVPLEHVEAVVHDNPRWEFDVGREGALHYIARIAALAALVPLGDATVTVDGFACGAQGCVDCTRMPQQQPLTRGQALG